MAQRYEIATTPDQTSIDARNFLFYLKRGVEKEVILAALRQDGRRTRNPSDKISILNAIMNNTEKRDDAEWEAKKIANNYDRTVIVAAPSSHIDPAPTEDIAIVEGCIAAIDFKKARLGIVTSAGRVSITYADIVDRPELTYPSVVAAVEIDFPGSVITAKRPN